MRHFNQDSGDVSALVDAFLANDPYFPRPHSENELYQRFRLSYISECPDCLRGRAQEFLTTLELASTKSREQAGR